MSNELTVTMREYAEPYFLRYSVRPELAGLVDEIVGYRENGRGISNGIELASLVVPLILSFGAPFSIALGRLPSAADRWSSFVGGLYAGPVHMASGGAAECIQINFTPLGAYHFFGLPMREFASRMVSIDDLNDGELIQFWQWLGEESSWERRFVLVENFVRNRLQRCAGVPSIATAAYARILAKHGNLKISQIAQDLGCSRKCLAERFQVEFGLTPKSIARMARFEHLLAMVKATASSKTRVDWADIAFACGYADQAHLTREFGEFSGIPPTRWLAEAA